MMEHPDDSALLRDIAAGDEEAFGRLYDRYGRLAYSVAWRVLGDGSAAEDAVQEAFLNVWRKAGSFDGRRGDARAWLLSVVHHRAVDLLRRSRGQQPLDLPTEPYHVAGDAEEVWKSVISVNLNGVYNCTKAFLDGMLARNSGRIVNIASIVGQMGNFGQANYAASKAGVIGLTKTLAKELAGKGVTVNAVAPGFIETDMVADVPDDVKERLLAQIPMRRFGKPEEVARAVVFLASDDSSYITGHVLNINGGMYV